MTEVCEICGDEVGEWQMVTKDYMTLGGGTRYDGDL